jgi:hypothetical protein
MQLAFSWTLRINASTSPQPLLVGIIEGLSVGAGGVLTFLRCGKRDCGETSSPASLNGSNL